MKFSTIIGILIIGLMGGSIYAKDIFRVDIHSQGKGIVLKYENVEGMKVEHPSWVPPKSRPYALVAYSSQELSQKEWTTKKIVFTPESDGNLKIFLRGIFAKNEKDKNWVLINKIKLNGKLYPNGDFGETFQKWGKTVPVGFWLYREGKYFCDAGEEGTPCVMVNHDNHLEFVVAVQKGKKYVFEFLVMGCSEDFLDD